MCEDEERIKDNGNDSEPEHLCRVCEQPMDEDERTEFKKCDGCGEEGCQHTIDSYEDTDYEYERFYCQDCLCDRIAKGKIRND